MNTRNHASHLIRHASRAAWAVVIAVAAFGLFATTGAAQVRARQTFNIPFEFIVGDTTCPPGTYIVKKSSEGVMAIVNDDNSTKVLFLAQIESCDKTGRVAELVFNRYGDVRYLDQVRPSDATSFHKLHRSPGQDDLARQWATQQETVLAKAK
jgi:hypothetical protein